MHNNRYFPMTLIAVAMVSACSSMSPNQALLEAHSHYNNARSNADISNLAPLELKDAGDSLNNADAALAAGEDDEKINQFAYIATQQVNIAQQTANRKTAELVVTNAGAKRNEVRLEARTAETVRDQAVIAEQQRQLDALNAKKTERGMVITLGDVLFNTGRAELKSEGIRNVQKLADFLGQYGEYIVSVEGHTDSVGTNEYNQLLSERRADAVQMALLNTGISNRRVAASGYGEGYPVAGNDNAGSRQLNRRVEIILSDNDGNIVPR